MYRAALWYRPQFMGQFWIGIAAWPAVSQYMNYDRTRNTGPVFGKFERTPTEEELNDLHARPPSAGTWAGSTRSLPEY